ncbi:hypothetical protein FJZ31_07605 [Candidatus Poribacteria bacterium]|nr:hypothetical protein [Candidatus Poribacteria bacterium]
MSNIVNIYLQDERLLLLLDNAVKSEINSIELGIKRASQKMKKFERKYKMSSEEFYNAFSNGELGDDFDFMEWAGEYELLVDLEQDIEKLRGINFAY